MNLYDIKKLQKIGEGTCGRCYLLESGDVLKKFKYPLSIEDIERFKYFNNYSNSSILFPFDFVYDDKKFYGYIYKKALGDKLSKEFPKSNLLDLSTSFVRLENNVKKISNGKIIMYDLHDENIIYDGKNLSVIDVDDYSIGNDSAENINKRNLKKLRLIVSNLFIENLYMHKNTFKLINRVIEYKNIDISLSELVLELKNEIDKYYKEDITMMEDLKKIR